MERALISKLSRAEKRETLNIPIKPAERNPIDRAAKALGRNRTDFIPGAARRAAEEAIFDQAAITVNPEAYEAFLARLDAPGRPNEHLRQTIEARPHWQA